MTTPRFLNILFFLFSSFSCMAQTHFEFHQMAKLSLKQLDYKGASRMMSKAIELNPGESSYFVERGHIYLGLEKEKKAYDDFKVAMRLDSMSVEPWIGKSLCHMYQGELDSALMVAHIAYILAENQYEQARAGSTLGEVFLSKEDDLKALEYFSESLLLDSTNNRGFKKAAQIAIRQKDYDQAETLLLQALNNDPRDLEVLINLAYTYNQLEYYRQSLEYCNMALSFDPTQPIARSNRAYAYFQLGETERALEDINLSIRNNKSNPMAHMYKGEILLATEDEKDHACKCFEKAKKLGGYSEENKALEELVAIHCTEKK